MPLLVKFQRDYADEFDVCGFAVFYDQERWKEHLNDVKELFEQDDSPKEVYFGTNEFVQYDDYLEYESSFQTQEIDKETANKLKELICYSRSRGTGEEPGYYGHFCTIEQ